MDAIATRADLTVGSIYRHFGSKAELLLRVVHEQMEVVRAHFEGATDTNAFVERATTYMRPEAGKLRRMAVELQAAATRNPEVASLILASNAAGAEQIRSAIQSRVPPDIDVEHAAQLVLVLLMGLTHAETLNQSIVSTRGWQDFLDGAIRRMLKIGDSG